ncbi:ABC transporter permease [Lacrimispora sphenoides]|jgi:iron(III) transport system permease protein|uniref:Iron(III) transport system permease protein n=1 Tax=Lacrimispora sphenoides JCM 1415 TaxID=1297793 RepID=A0ABY1C940_9FIRM|nr:iron ABC transporter permease [Lacrimispora sphenoides]SET81955.1 iron(III) transport system permease protein [[Clostridium] sphenoides JCM 1415]SUY51518.1 binding-protein-dependent transport system inner membrane protein [Lacrimispora sphenoides]
MVKKGWKFDFWFWVKVVVVGFMLLFLIYPFCTLITRSFFSGKVEGFTLENYIRFFSKKYYYSSLGRSLFVSIVTTATTLVVGVPMAYLMSRYNIFGKRFIHIFIIMSLMSPPFIGAYSWIMLFGRAGFVTRFFESIGIFLPSIYGKLGIILVFTFKLFPYVYLYTSGAMGSIDSSLEEAAENLGSNKLRRLLTITIPVILPSIAAGAIMVFMTSLADFGTPMLIGEGYMVLPVLVYNEYMSEIGGNAHLASALSVIVVLCSTTVLLLQKYFVTRKNYVMTAMRPPKEEQLHGFKRFLVTLPVMLVTFIGILPQIVVVVSSFIKSDFTGFKKGFSIESYVTIFNRLWTNIRNTFVFSATAIVFIIILGMLISYIVVRQKGIAGQLMDLLIMFPFVIPGAVLGISLIVAFNKQPMILTGTAAIMIIAFVVRKLPYTVRSGSAFLQQMDPSVEEASISLGVSPMKTFAKVTARLMAPGILSGAILSWITCINELSSSVMLYGGKTSTISVAIYTEVVRNSYGTAAALASILTVSTVISLLIFLKVSKGKVSVV